VVADLQPFRKIADADLVPCRHALHRQQQLVLLRFDADGRSSVFAEGQETPYLVAKLGQGTVIGRYQSALFPQGEHLPYSIVLRCIYISQASFSLYLAINYES